MIFRSKIHDIDGKNIIRQFSKINWRVVLKKPDLYNNVELLKVYLKLKTQTLDFNFI